MTDNIWPLLLPSKAVDTIMTHTGAWKEIEKELSQVTSVARIGNELSVSVATRCWPRW